jgi:hypothetical protein
MSVHFRTPGIVIPASLKLTRSAQIHPQPSGTKLMKIKLPTILTILAGVSLLGSPREAAAEPRTLMVHADVISVPKATAENLLGSPEIATNPGAALDKLRDLIARHEAVSIAAPTARSKVGERGAIRGRLFIEWETTLQKDNTGTVTAYIKQGEDGLLTSFSFALGQVVFVGSFDAAHSPGGSTGGESGTYMIFMRFQ